MENNFKCWKEIDASNVTEQMVLSISGGTYALLPASKKDIEIGTPCLNWWYIEKKYKTQIAGLGQVYYDIKSEIQKLLFEELIFKGTECIGVYHDELIFIFDDNKTHYQEKYLGEMPTGPDQGIDFYDYYYLRSSR